MGGKVNEDPWGRYYRGPLICLVVLWLQVHVEPKEDYSHLPPEQQKRKLQAKVDDLDAAVQKAISDK